MNSVEKQAKSEKSVGQDITFLHYKDDDDAGGCL